MHFDHEINLSNLNCPLPVLKTKAALVKVGSGETLKITVTSSDSVREIGTLADQTNANLVHVDQEDGSHQLFFTKQ